MKSALRSRTPVALGCVLSLALLIAGCSSKSSSASGAGSASTAPTSANSATSATSALASAAPASTSPALSASSAASTGAAAASSPAAAAGCSPAAGTVKMAFIETNEEAGYFQDMKNGVVAEAKACGVSLAIYNANSDPSKQVEAIQTYVQQGYKALLVSPIDENGLVAALTAAHDKGVKTIIIDSDMSGPEVDLSVGTDNAAAAVIAGNWLINWEKTQNANKPLRIGIIGALTSVPQNQRKDSFVSTVEPTGVKILQTVDGNNVQSTAETAAQNLYTAQPTMNLLYATGEPALIGAIAAEKASNATARVKVFGWDLSPEAIQGIDSGTVIGVVQQAPDKEGEISIQSAMTLLGGGTTAKHIATSVTVVTKANVDTYRSVYGK